MWSWNRTLTIEPGRLPSLGLQVRFTTPKLPVLDYDYYASRTIRPFPRPPLQIPLLLLRIDMPNDIIRQADDLIPRPVGHGRKALRIGLVLEGVAGEVYTYINDN